MTTILAPVDLSAATKAGPRVFRKQLLRKGRIDYPVPGGGRRRVVFDDAYLTDLAAAFNAGAYDHVPFLLAGPDNAHTMDPTRFQGWIKGVEVTEDGLDGILELSDDAAALVDRTGGKLGVSVRIKPVEHVDGRAYPRAINHVLGTLDPRLQGPTLALTGWQSVDLSTHDGADDVLDLSGATYQEGNPMPKMIDLSTLSEDERERLRSWAAANDIDLAEADEDDDLDEDTQDDDQDDDQDDTDESDDDADDATDEGDDGDDGEGITDADLDALIDAELASQGAGTDLSADDDDSLDLAAGIVSQHGDDLTAERRESARLRADLAARDYIAAGVPPHVVDLATPVLALTDADADALDLSDPADGKAVNARAIVTGILDAMRGTVDLSDEAGRGDDDDDSDTGEDSQADRLLAQLDLS